MTAIFARGTLPRLASKINFDKKVVYLFPVPKSLTMQFSLHLIFRESHSWQAKQISLDFEKCFELLKPLLQTPKYHLSERPLLCID